jgi:rod shape-determining protein MreD
MPTLFYFLTWACVTFVQVVVTPRLAIRGVFPDILIAVIIVIALRYGRLTGVWFAFALAFSIDLLDPQKLGWMTLLASFLAYGVGVIRETIYIENPWFESAMVLIGTFFYHVMYCFFPAPQFFISNFSKMVAESFLIAVYTSVVIGIIIVIFRQRYGYRDLA